MQVQTLKAVSHPFRKHIIDQLASGEAHTTAELSRDFPMTKAAVSQHLKLLRDSGLVIEQKQGRTKSYAINPAKVEELLDWAETFARFWSDKLSSLNQYLERTHGTKAPRAGAKNKKPAQ